MASEVLIKGMVSERCITVADGIRNLGHDVREIGLGKISLSRELDQQHFLKYRTVPARKGV